MAADTAEDTAADTERKPAVTARIVVGVDGSPASLDALSWAATQAELTGSILELVMTWDWPSSLGWSVPIPDDFDPADDVRRALDAAADPVRTAHPDIQIELRVVNGHPAPCLVETSKGADLLVVGSRGHGEFVGMLLGSVSEFCTTNAHCPVLVHRAAT
jgi:nucleotide-binding universal stress UspA family protein